jgi:hypothetical protein
LSYVYREALIGQRLFLDDRVIHDTNITDSIKGMKKDGYNAYSVYDELEKVLIFNGKNFV